MTILTKPQGSICSSSRLMKLKQLLLKKRGGLSDANIMSAFCPVCIDSLGPTGGGDHSEREFLWIDTIQPHTEFAYELICDLAND